MNAIGYPAVLSPSEFGCVLEPLTKRPIEKLVRALSRCTYGDYCAYHDKKRNNKAIRLPRYIPAEASASSFLRPDTQLMTAIRNMRDAYDIAGSWQLMGEQREWIDSRLALRWQDHAQSVRIAILGVPGITHLWETVKLLTQRLDRAARIEFFVFERCIRPLTDIEMYLHDQGFEKVAIPPREVRLRPLASLTSDITSFHLLQCDLAQECPLAEQSIDIACSHLLFSFLNRPEALVVLDNIASYLHATGQFLLAQDATDPNQLDWQNCLERRGLVAVDSAKAWNLYDLTDNQCDSILRGETIDIKNRVLLMDIQKVDRRDATR